MFTSIPTLILIHLLFASSSSSYWITHQMPLYSIHSRPSSGYYGTSWRSELRPFSFWVQVPTELKSFSHLRWNPWEMNWSRRQSSLRVDESSLPFYGNHANGGVHAWRAAGVRNGQRVTMDAALPIILVDAGEGMRPILSWVDKVVTDEEELGDGTWVNFG
jgi:hypothetical protein